jgi:hypothetical protein
MNAQVISACLGGYLFYVLTFHFISYKYKTYTKLQASMRHTTLKLWSFFLRSFRRWKIFSFKKKIGARNFRCGCCRHPHLEIPPHIYVARFEDLDHSHETRVEDAGRLPKFATWHRHLSLACCPSLCHRLVHSAELRAAVRVCSLGLVGA